MKRALLAERIFRGGIETRSSAANVPFTLRARHRKTTGTVIAAEGLLTFAMCAYRPLAFISGARNSRLSGQASGGTGHARRHPSLVGAGLLRQEMGAKNCGNSRGARRTRFRRTKAICGWEDILSCFRALSRHASTTAARTLIVSSPTVVTGFAIPSHVDSFSSKK
jgi:hypothetical protein